ncbi:MAG: hypothetical protein JWN00_1450 [Actinomycetia bacterium]|nr:hypothetical protein [Actinomycetes bacterium]
MTLGAATVAIWAAVFVGFYTARVRRAKASLEKARKVFGGQLRVFLCACALVAILARVWIHHHGG